MKLSFKKLVSLMAIFSTGIGLTTSTLLDRKITIPELVFSKNKFIYNLENPIKNNQLSLESTNLVDLNVNAFKLSGDKSLEIESNVSTESLNIQGNLNQKLSSTIKESYSEMDKEIKAKEISKKSSEVIEQFQSKLSKKDIQTVKDIAQKYRDYNSSTNPRRRRRGVDSSNVSVKREKPILNNEDRISLSKYYSQFVNLNEFKNHFEEELENLTENPVDVERKEEINRDSKKFQEGLSSLKSIRWEDADLKLFGGQYGERRKDVLDPQRVRSWKNIECNDEHCGWSNWEENPYKNFFKDELEWKKFISDITSPQKKVLENLDNPKKIACSFLFFPGVENFISYYGLLWFMRKAYIFKNGPELKKLNESDCGASEQSELFKEIQDAKTNLQFKIGSDLLKRMNLLNPSR